MVNQARDVIARVRKWREVQSIQHGSAETLERVKKFMQDHETVSTNDFTHTVFDCYYDWWIDPKSSFKLQVVDDSAIDLLNWCIAQCYDLGVPLTLAEKRTPEIRFVQDLSIWGTETAAVKVDELVVSDGCFMNLLGQTMGTVFTESEFLDLVIFDATGFSKTKGVMKTSLRFVWSGIVVDKERALRIHDYVVHKFKETAQEDVKALLFRMHDCNRDNVWNAIFSDEVYQGRHGVRMPLNDRVSPSPMKAPENRPFAPVSVLRFMYQEGKLQRAERIAEKENLETVGWVKIGSIRQVAGTPLMQWTEPQWQGPRPTRGHVAQGNQGGLTVASPAAAGAARSAGQVKLRTRNGSDGYEPRPRVPRNGPAVKEERRVELEREFDGTMDEFKEKLVEKLGQENWNFTQDDYALTCTKAGDGNAQIVFKAKSKRVYVSGTQQQVRIVLSVIQLFAQGVGEAARSVAQTQCSHAPGSVAGSAYGGSAYASSHAPSLAPSHVYAPSVAPSMPRSELGAGAASASASAGAAGSSSQSERVATRVTREDFIPESAGELALAARDRVSITNDPEEDFKNIHRWVYGTNLSTEQTGWFPYSHTIVEEA